MSSCMAIIELNIEKPAIRRTEVNGDEETEHQLDVNPVDDSEQSRRFRPLVIGATVVAGVIGLVTWRKMKRGSTDDVEQP